ncbi:hypothetical protein FRC03_008633 [Tulasnella sp. 419]|nr:hypothetical protein FRC03_008633 [Tulasnella sp. 419]
MSIPFNGQNPDLTFTLDNLVDCAPGEQPNYAMHKIIQYAIQGSEHGELTLQGIIDAIIYKYPGWYAGRTTTLNRTVKHNLSEYPKFVNTDKPLGGKGKARLWRIDPSRVNDPAVSSSNSRAVGSQSTHGSNPHNFGASESSRTAGGPDRRGRPSSRSPTRTRQRCRPNYPTSSLMEHAIHPPLPPSGQSAETQTPPTLEYTHSPSGTIYTSSSPSTQPSISPFTNISHSPTTVAGGPSDVPIFDDRGMQPYPSVPVEQNKTPTQSTYNTYGTSLFPNGSGIGFIHPSYAQNAPSISNALYPAGSSMVQPNYHSYQSSSQYLSTTPTIPAYPPHGYPSQAPRPSHSRYYWHPSRPQEPAIDPNLDFYPPQRPRGSSG